jgi:organic radical activating enzyme
MKEDCAVPSEAEAKIRKRKDELASYQPDSVTPAFPRTLLVEVSNVCNHRCVFCAYSKQTRPGKLISPELMERLLREAYALGAREVGYYSGAEPFTCKHLERLIQTAKGIGYEYIYVSTNGVLATPKRLQACVDNGLDSIKFSVNAGDRETYRQIHGEDDFETVVRHIQFVDEYRKRMGKPFYLAISFVVMDQPGGSSNVATKDRLHALLGDVVDEIVFYEAVNQSGQQHGLPTVPGFQAPCALPFARCHISAEGYLRMCCNDYQNYLALVDLNQTTLEDAWKAQVFQQMRQKHLDKDLKGTLCHNCVHGLNEPIRPIVPELATEVGGEFFEFVDRPPNRQAPEAKGSGKG